MRTNERDDPTWQAAWFWVMLEHEQPLSDTQRDELARWLQADPSHRKVYEEASRLWLLSGLVPPRHEGAADPAPEAGTGND